MTIILKTRCDGVKQRFHISSLRPQIKKLYLEGLSSRKVGEKLGISHARVLQLLKKENVNRRNLIKPITNKFHKKLTFERAYLLGVMCGDGCVFSGMANKDRWLYKNYIVYLAARDKDFVDEFIRCANKIYGFTPSLYFRKRSKLNKRWSDIWIARITRKEVYKDLSPYNFGTNTWKVPKEIIDSKDEKIIGAFLKGFYDSEGSISMGPRSFNLFIHSNNYEGIMGVKSLLERLGIKIFKIMKDIRLSRNPTFFFIISSKKNLEIFLNRVGFSIQRKQNKLKEHLE